MKVKAPKCPICNEIMIAVRIECHDGSGHIFGWSCGCNEKKRKGVEYIYKDWVKDAESR